MSLNKLEKGFEAGLPVFEGNKGCHGGFSCRILEGVPFFFCNNDKSTLRLHGRRGKGAFEPFSR